jgi:hypothetical protein
MTMMTMQQPLLSPNYEQFTALASPARLSRDSGKELGHVICFTMTPDTRDCDALL